MKHSIIQYVLDSSSNSHHLAPPRFVVKYVNVYININNKNEGKKRHLS
jgi:hypothetical protein